MHRLSIERAMRNEFRPSRAAIPRDAAPAGASISPQRLRRAGGDFREASDWPSRQKTTAAAVVFCWTFPAHCALRSQPAVALPLFDLPSAAFGSNMNLAYRPAEAFCVTRLAATLDSQAGLIDAPYPGSGR
jgi:hypothetical protein